MGFKALKKKLEYPHKSTAFEYFLRSPSLLFVLSPKPSKFYFSKTLENILGLNLILCLHNFLPERFLEHLKEKRFTDTDGILLILYSIIKVFKPEIVVETGVVRGASSAFILCAMHENCKGHLYSIDLPPSEHYTKIEKDGGVGA